MNSISKEIHEIADCQMLQNDLTIIEHWCKDNNLALNVRKYDDVFQQNAQYSF